MRINLLIPLCSVILLSGCKYLKENSMFNRGVDTLLNEPVVETEPVAAAVDSSQFFNEQEPAPPEPVAQTSIGYGSDKYYMIVGSFQNQNLAKRYADKITGMGYPAQIIDAGNGFFRVSAKSYSNYQSGIGDISVFRSSVSQNAWLHIKE